MKKKIKKIVLAVLIAASVTCSALIPASAASSVIDCSKMSKMVIGANTIPYLVGEEKGNNYTLIPIGTPLYMPQDSNYGDFEMWFPLGIQINTGDVFTLTYDVWFGGSLNAGTQLVMPGFTENYISASGRWESDGLATFFHWSGSATVTAGNDTEVLKIIPRGLSGGFVGVVTLTISVKDKDYTGSINNATGDIKANADKNAQDIKDNADKNAQDIKDNQDKNTQKQIDEDYGYTKPDSTGTDEGINAGTNLIESLNQWIDEFNEELPTSVSHIMDDIQPFKSMVHKIFDVFPVALQYLFTFAMVFLVLRKVVGR